MKDTQNAEFETQGFDWSSVRQRIASVNATLSGLDGAAPDTLEQIWAHRAVKLAQAPAQEEEGEQIELVLVQLGREVYGLEAQYVFDIRLAENVTRVPRVPAWVAGIVNLRGRILSVLHLQRLFGLPQAECSEEGRPATFHLVVVETPDMEIVLLVDNVLAVESLTASRIQAPTDTIHGLRLEYVRGVAEYKDDGNDGMMVVLDLSALLADKRLIVNEEIS